MFCSRCGNQVPDHASFCTHCGASFGAAPQPSQQPSPFQTPPPLAPQPPVPQQNPYQPPRPMPQQPPRPAAPAPAPQPQGNAGKPEKKKGKKWALWISLIAVGVLAIVALVLFLILGNKLELTNFAADEIYLVSQMETEITFTVTASEEVDSITLYQDGEEVGTMRDNGKKGDAQAGDGIYTARVKVKEKARKLTTLQFTCEVDNTTSDVLEVYVFPELDENSAMEAAEEYQNLAENITDVTERYLDDEGNIPESDRDKALEKVTKLLEEAIEDKIVLHYSVTDYTVSIKLTSGLNMIWMPPDHRYDEVGEETRMTVLTLQPCLTEMGGEAFGEGFTGYELPEDVNYLLEMMDVSGRKLSDTLPNYRFPNSQNYDDEGVTLEVIRSFGENQIILWHGHGGYNTQDKSFLLTGERFDQYRIMYDAAYRADCITNRILCSNTGYVLVTGKYITKYCGDMNNTFVYLAACRSGQSADLAGAFTTKGATVVANDESILRVYNVVMLYATVDQMLKVNPETGKFYTVEEALEIAKSIYGTSDADARYGGRGARPLVFGDGTYRLMEEVPTGTISGKVARAHDRISPIANATIDVYLGDTLYTTVTADSNGMYSLELPFGECTVHISAPGFISFYAYTEVQAGTISYMETFLMVQGNEQITGVASGQVINSLSGTGEAYVDLKITKNWNNDGPDAEVLKTLTTDDHGYYSVELPCGNYTVIAEKEDYSKSSFNIIVQEGYTGNQDGTITAVINGNDYLITLTWGQNPVDVDSHLVGYMEDGAYYHVYYASSQAYRDNQLVCELDYDDTTSYGPEHITLTATDAGSYYYYLHKYEGSGPLSASEARVTIEQGNRLIAVFYVPADQGNGRYWNVFCIKDGEVIVANTITGSPDTSYAD